MKLSFEFWKKPLFSIAAILAAVIAALLAMWPGPWVLASPPKDPWPVGDGDTAYPVHNAYGQFEDYGYGSDYHDGIDIMVDVSPVETVFAIESGVVADVYDSDDPVNYSIVVLSDDDPTTGYYYVHFEPTAGLGKGDTVAADTPIGTTIGYKDASDYDHLHLSRVQQDPTAPSSSVFPYVFVENPLARLKSAADDTRKPTVEEVLFFQNGSTKELTSGADFVGIDVDIVARVSDHHLASDDRPMIPYRVRVETHDVSGATVYENELEFDGQFGESRSKFVSTAYKKDGAVTLKGDYDDREFWVVPTNVLPDESSAAWSPASGKYEVRVTAFDLAGNESDEMEKSVTVPAS